MHPVNIPYSLLYTYAQPTRIMDLMIDQLIGGDGGGKMASHKLNESHPMVTLA